MKHLPTMLIRPLLVAVMLTAALTVLASPSNKWRLEFSGGADSNGEIISNTVKGVRIHPEHE
jgi:hypothetical protein